MASNSPSSGAGPAVAKPIVIPKTLVIKGSIVGSESVYIEGSFEGSLDVASNRVTVGRNAQVAADIRARDVVVLGRVSGNCTATERVQVREEGSLIGDVVCQNISIEEGAFFKGGVELRRPVQRASEEQPSEAASA